MVAFDSDEFTPVEDVLRELMANYDAWLASLISPMTPRQILCVHSNPLEPFERTDENTIRSLVQWHILKDSTEECDVSGAKEQYERM